MRFFDNWCDKRGTQNITVGSWLLVGVSFKTCAQTVLVSGASFKACVQT